MESNQFDTPESISATRNPINDHLHYPAAADEQSIEKIVPAQASERPVHCDKIYVGNLPPEVSLVDLHKAFKRFGQITDIQLPYNTGPGGKPKGYAFIMFNNGVDAARAQVKMDGAILSKRIIKVDFAHQEKFNPIPKSRRSAKDATQVTTLSMLKGNQHTRSTMEQIALAEAKLLELGRADLQDGFSKSSSSPHPSLPSKPHPVGSAQSGSCRSSKTNSVLPSLPLATPTKPSHNTVPKTSTSSLHSVSMPSGSFSTFTKKAPKLAGIKMIKKSKDIINVQEN